MAILFQYLSLSRVVFGPPAGLRCPIVGKRLGTGRYASPQNSFVSELRFCPWAGPTRPKVMAAKARKNKTRVDGIFIVAPNNSRLMSRRGHRRQGTDWHSQL